ncbi:MAG: Gfo/Idh/MocA family oxidoreductase [Alphaproteobacteria bacterium]|nr:Gfo/Idh/MocA family oxidoreductase [Alphaproteobacteria bacterium]
MKSNLGILSSNINSLEFLTLNGLNDYFNYYAVASRNIEDSQAISSNFNIKKYYGSYEELVKDPNIDFVINFLPNSIKFEYSYLLLKAQKKVITNYPVFNSTKDIIYVEEIISSSLDQNIFLIQEYNYSKLLDDIPNHIFYSKFSSNNYKSNLSMMKDLLVEESPDLFFLLNHYKNSKINIDILKKKYDSLHFRLSYLNALITIDGDKSINVLIDNINKIHENSIIVNSNSYKDNFEIRKNVIKAYNHDDLLLFIKNNKTFDNSTFFQYYPFKLFNEVLNV